MDNIIFDLGFIQIKWYSLFILLAMLTASFLIYKEAKKKHINEEILINLIFYGIIIGIIGARLYYVIFNFNYYINNLLEIFMMWKGGLAIHGGIIAALIFLIIYCKKNKINIMLLLDIIVIGLIIAQAIGRWGNFFNQEAFGRITSFENLQKLKLPNFIINGMFINGYYREPTFLLESFFLTIGFIILIVLRKIKKLKVGQLSSFYLIWYGIIRFIIESLRSDSLMLFNFKVAQLVSLLFIFAGIFILIISTKKNKIYQKETF